MKRALLLYAVCLLALSAVGWLLWRDLHWGESLELPEIGAIVVLLAIGGVLFRTASEAWSVRHQGQLVFAEHLPEPHKIIAENLSLQLRVTATDLEGTTGKIDIKVRKVARSGDRVWVLAQQRLGKNDKHGTRIALSEGALSYITEKQTGQFIADNLGSWLVSRADGWQRKAQSER